MTNDFKDLHEEDFQDLINEVKAAGEVPDPSPMFWNHLSARVRDAVATEPIPGPWWVAYWRPLLLSVGAVASVALVVIMRFGASAPVTNSNAAIASANAAAAHELVADVEVSEMWRLIQVAAPALEIDSVRDAGLMPSEFATDQAIQSLTPAEREALVRLLRKEMGVTE